MAKNDWKALQAQFEHDHDKYGTSAKDWCEAKGLNYQSARRYIKVRTAQNDNAQTAQKVSAQSKTAQSAQKKSKSGKAKPSREKSQQDKSDSSNSTDADFEKPKMDERDKAGRFLPGHSFSVGHSGNPNPENQFQPGNQVARRSGVYSRLLSEDKKTMHEFSKIATLEDELDITRTRMQSGIEFIEKVTEDIANANSQEERISLYEIYQKTESRMDVLTARIESLTKTLSSLGIDVVNSAKIIEDTKRIKNASRKLALEADALQNEGKGDDTPVASIVDEIQSMSKSGLMSE